jgi:hypothetical protein
MIQIKFKTKMKSALLIGAFATISQMVVAQVFDYTLSDHWFETTGIHKLNPEFKTASAVGILDERNIEYKVEGKEILQYSTYHRIVGINDDKGIEMYNKVYVPVYSGATITELKARTVTRAGKVINLATEKVKQIEEEGRVYKLFAMEGVEKGCEIEYSYTIKKKPTFFGMEVFQTSSIPYQKVLFSLAVPTNLKFDAKAFNDFKLSKDSVFADKRIIVGYDDNVPEIDEEKYAVREPYLKRVEYKLSYNVFRGTERLYTWNDFAKRAYTIYTTLTSKEEKALAPFISNIKLDDINTPEGKVLAIEDYIKSNINIDKNLVGEDAGTIDKIIKSKSANSEGIVHLFASIFEKAGIDYQTVFVGSRDGFPLDESLENWNRLDETVFFFPATGNYISPLSIDLRSPYIPAYWAGTRGLFLKGSTIGSLKTATASFGDIVMQSYDKSGHDMEVSVRFDETLDTLIINSKQILTGYGAAGYRPIYTFLPKDKQNEANLQIIKAVAKSTDIKNIKVENTLLTDYADNKPLSISADIKSTEMIERAGNKVLLKIGDIIGPQEQMYQEKPRKLPVELPYPHALDRKIILEIPQGYNIKNLNDLNINIEHKEGNEATMGFVSMYERNGNTINIDVKESYKKIKYPISQFEDFRKVINASADFNKIVLVLEKTKG